MQLVQSFRRKNRALGVKKKIITLQKDSIKSLREELARATQGLLGAGMAFSALIGGVAQAQNPSIESSGLATDGQPSTPSSSVLPIWRVDSALLYYAEQERMTIVEPVFFMKRQIAEDQTLGAKLVLDAITGSSPSGASATTRAQTINAVTSASGGAGTTTTNAYNAAAYATPTNAVKDERIAFSVEWNRPLTAESTDWRAVYSGFFSYESDYTSLGGGVNFLHEMNDKHTTLTLGISTNIDVVHPNLIPTPMAQLNPVSTQQMNVVKDGDDDGEYEDDNDDGNGDGDEGKRKKGVDILIGVTQVLSRNALLQLNYSMGKTIGYLTDPYKILSVVDGVSGETVDYRYESRPDNRLRQSVFAKLNYAMGADGADVWQISYRYFWDNWSIRTHTIDTQYRYELSRNIFIEPHLRYSQQSAADFYRHSLVAGNIPIYASADYRLGELTTTTAGVKMGMTINADWDFSARVEQMIQAGDSHPVSAIGVQKQVDLFPKVQVNIFQVTLSTKF